MKTSKLAIAGGVLAAMLLPASAHAAYTAQVDAGILKVTGDGASDRLRLDADGPGTLLLDVGVDGTADFSFDKSTFTAVEITAGGGDDEVSLGAAAANDKTVSVDGGGGDDTLLGGAGPETFNGGSGNDVVDGNLGADVALLGSGNDRFNWDPGDNSDAVEGQGGTDTLDFNGANIGELFDLSANGERVRFTRNIANITMDLDDVEALNLFAKDGADTVTVNNLTGTDLKTASFDQAESVVANGTPGDDQFALASDGSVTGFGFPLKPTAISGGDGSDTTTFTGTAGDDAIDVVANGTAARIAGVDVTTENLVVNAGNGADSFSAVGNLAAITALTVDGGGGDDTLRGGNGVDTLLGGSGSDTVDGNQGNDTASLGSGADHFAWDPGDGSDTVEGQTGTDTLDFNGSAIGELFDLSANGERVRFTRNIANITMDLDEVEALNVLARAGTDTATVGDLTGTDLKRAAFDLGADGVPDTVVLNGTDERDSVNVSRSGSAVVARGLKPELTVTGSELFDTLRIQTLAGDDRVTLAPGVDTLISPAIDLGPDN